MMKSVRSSEARVAAMVAADSDTTMDISGAADAPVASDGTGTTATNRPSVRRAATAAGVDTGATAPAFSGPTSASTPDASTRASETAGSRWRNPAR
jgi:hypothetical protein